MRNKWSSIKSESVGCFLLIHRKLCDFANSRIMISNWLHENILCLRDWCPWERKKNWAYQESKFLQQRILTWMIDLLQFDCISSKLISNFSFPQTTNYSCSSNSTADYLFFSDLTANYMQTRTCLNLAPAVLLNQKQQQIIQHKHNKAYHSKHVKWQALINID